jgi:1-phosphatidylinositol phosphodiesterase
MVHFFSRRTFVKAASGLLVGAGLGDAAFGISHASIAMGAPSLLYDSWMGGIPDDVLLSQLTIPGTHESCCLGAGGPLVQCQNRSITDQLNNGIRFLDIRVRRYKSGFTIHHGPVYQGKTLTDVLNECIPFLRQHPSECIIISIKAEEGNGGLFDPPPPYNPTYSTIGETFEKTYTKWYYDNGNEEVPLWYFQDDNPHLGQVRGRIVLFNRFQDYKEIVGVGPYTWPDNATFDGLGYSCDYLVEDKYKVPTPFDIGKKKEAIWRHMKSAAKGAKMKSWSITFTSGSSLAACPILVASQVNKWLHSIPSSLNPNEHNRIGIVPMDFPDNTNIGWLISWNLSMLN